MLIFVNILYVLSLVTALYDSWHKNYPKASYEMAWAILMFLVINGMK